VLLNCLQVAACSMGIHLEIPSLTWARNSRKPREKPKHGEDRLHSLLWDISFDGGDDRNHSTAPSACGHIYALGLIAKQMR
jgi:hypothetical protein